MKNHSYFMDNRTKAFTIENSYTKTGFFFLIIIPLVGIGFYPSYFSFFPTQFQKIDFLVHLHFFFSALWIVILILQPFLIINKHYRWHKRLGKVTYIIFPLWIMSFLPMINNLIQSEKYNVLVFPIGTMTLLIIFYALAIKNRKIAAKHMRYFIASAIVLIDPTIGRWTYTIFQNDLIAMPITYGIMNLILVALIWMDKRNGKDYQPYLVALSYFLLYNIAFFLVFLN